MTYRKLLNRLFYQTAYLKIGKRVHLSFKRLISLPCMMLGHQNHPRILLEREQQESTSTSA